MAQSKINKNIMKAIETLDFQILLDVAAMNRSKKDKFTFYDAFKEASESNFNTLICGLNNMLLKLMEQRLGSINSANWMTLNEESWIEIGQIIQAAIDLTLTSFQYNYSPSSHVIQMAVLLNGILLQLPDSLDNVKNNIAHFCEKCSSNAGVKSHYFLFNVLIYLLRRTLGKKALKVDIKRVYNLRSNIRSIITMDQANKIEVWELLRKCAASSLYLYMLEGQKILALAMTLDIDKIIELHKDILAQFDYCSLNDAALYGKIYFEAWSYCFKAQKNEMLNVLEIVCLQDYILLAIRNHKRAYVPIVRKLLGQFHCHKKQFEVAKMLYILYQPLLWRYLKNPHGQTRANAAQLFLDIFPVEDPDVKIVATDLELNDQLLMIQELLTDEYPIVRVTTIIGLCVQLSVNWEIFPEESLKTFFRIFINDLCRDSSSSEVRCAVAKGIKVVLENPLTTNSMQNILPKLSFLFHDNSENVRIAFCNLLLRVKNIASIKYFDIVPLEHLLSRIQKDCHAVRKCIANLIHNSYFPRNETTKIWLGRCLQIMTPENAPAARIFFNYVAAFIGVTPSVKFMITCIKTIHYYVKTKNTATEVYSYMESSNKENVADGRIVITLEEAVGFQNPDVVRCLLNCLSIMWLSLKLDTDKDENKRNFKLLVGKVGKPLAELCHHYQTTKAWDSVFYISSFLSPTFVPSLASLCFLRLKNLPLEADESEYLVILECLCNQQQGSELLELLKSWIEVGLDDSYTPPVFKKRKILKKNGQSVYFDVPKPYLANEMINSMFSYNNLQRAILQHDDILKKIMHFVDDVKIKFELSSTKGISDKEAEFLKLLLLNIVKLAAFLHNEILENGIKFITELVCWTDKKMLKNLKVSEKKKDVFTDIISDYCKNLCEVLSDLTGLGLCDPNSRVNFKFFSKLLHTSYCDKYAVISAKFLYKYAASAQYVYVEENEPIMVQNLLECLCPILAIYNDPDFLKRLLPSVLKELQFILANVLHIVLNHIPLFGDLTSEVIKSIIRFIINGIIKDTKCYIDELIVEPFENITYPMNSAFFFSVLTLKPKIFPLYMKYFMDFYTNESCHTQDMSLWIASWVFVKNILGMKSLTQSALNEAHFMIIALENSLYDKYPMKKCDDLTKNTEIQIFQKHCRSEFLKLKSQQYSKMCAFKRNFH